MYPKFFVSSFRSFVHELPRVLMLFSMSLMATPSIAAPPIVNQESPTDRIIIKYKPQTMASGMASQVSQMKHLNSAAGTQLRYLHTTGKNAHVLSLSKKMPLNEVQAISKKLMALPEVQYAEPDRILHPMLVPNDPGYPNQWDYFDLTGGSNLPAAWDIMGTNSIIVAVVDTGITNHQDLIGQTVPGYDFVSDTLMSNDGDGRDNDPTDPGDWVSSDDTTLIGWGCPVKSSSWHGTHVAGTIAAKSNNGIGIAGINWTAKILPVRVLGKCGGYTSDITDGMLWAAGVTINGIPTNPNPAKVINLSLGGSGSCSLTEQDAIDAINAKNSVVVVAAGNSNMDASGFSPASCNGVISVAANDKLGDKAYYSNFGSNVTISAPGGAQSYENDPNGILSTLNAGTQGQLGDAYVYYQGTSMAAPHISGIVSLMFAKNPNLTLTQVRDILQSTARPFPNSSSCNTSICGSGIVDAAASLTKVPPIPPIIKTLTVTSSGLNDGLILESSEKSNLGGQLNSTSSVFYLGDDALNKQYRSILSFDTSALPNNAVITKATLIISYAGMSGTSPLKTHGALLADIRKPIFGKSNALELADFSAAPDRLSAATFNKVPVNNQYSAVVSNLAVPYINLSGTTQFRLRFYLDDNNDFGKDIISFYSGNATASYRPKLVINYYVPGS